MERYLKSKICQDLPHKIVLVMGARQCGKTTLARSLYPTYDYYNFDALQDRQTLLKQSWDRRKPLIIFDELHKMKQWKRWLKGIYDTEGIPPELLVTGNARLDTFTKVGDSLAGRYFQFHLHPLDLKELVQFSTENPVVLFQRLYECSGFPEPYLKGTPVYYKRWRTTHLDIILRQDLIDLYTVQDLKTIETLILLLKERVGSSVSYSNLARDLQKDVSTIKRWLQILENLYVIYRVTPYSQKIARSLLKEPKFYFYDHNHAENNEGAKLENLVANALLKELDFIRDTLGERVGLYYLRTKEGKEIDFLVSINNKPTHMIEVKTQEEQPTPSFAHFLKFLPNTQAIQLVKNIRREKTYPSGVEVRELVPWLASMNLLSHNVNSK
ncbi:MAG: ATPase [Coxiella sp. RIFCSPHIGHO2_12_FULL_42_15]|nr:MAG: ATPase [Coxiella sp. RIFCSPHIGHO2_12_FULL_42_15]